jgi:aerobic C4-dicarboxylate transport protein
MMRPTNRPPWYSSLFLQLLVAIVAGALVGWLWPDAGGSFKPLADGFIKLIKMLIAPIVFCTVVLGITHVGDLKSVGRIGVKALIYFEAVTTFALLFGLVVGNVVRPGHGFSVDPQTLATGADAVARKTHDGKLPYIVEFLLGVIPNSVVSAFAENALLQVLFLAVLFGLALAKLGEQRPPAILEFVDHISGLFFTIIGWVMRLAPLSVFGAMAYIIGQYGLGSLASYAKLIAACYLAAVLFILILATIAWFFAGVNLWKFVVYIKDELFLALGTASSEVVLPRIMTKLTNAGCSRTTTGLVVPAGYSFNMDGAALYLSISLLFLAQALDVHLTPGEQITAVLILMLTSKGMAGVPGASFLVLLTTVTSIGHHAIPVAAVALLLGAHRIMDSMRVSVNVLGNCVATFVVANWQGQLDKDRMKDVLNRAQVPTLAEPDPMDGEANEALR